MNILIDSTYEGNQSLVIKKEDFIEDMKKKYAEYINVANRSSVKGNKELNIDSIFPENIKSYY